MLRSEQTHKGGSGTISRPITPTSASRISKSTHKSRKSTTNAALCIALKLSTPSTAVKAATSSREVAASAVTATEDLPVSNEQKSFVDFERSSGHPERILNAELASAVFSDQCTCSSCSPSLGARPVSLENDPYFIHAMRVLRNGVFSKLDQEVRLATEEDRITTQKKHAAVLIAYIHERAVLHRAQKSPQKWGDFVTIILEKYAVVVRTQVIWNIINKTFKDCEELLSIYKPASFEAGRRLEEFVERFFAE